MSDILSCRREGSAVTVAVERIVNTGSGGLPLEHRDEGRRFAEKAPVVLVERIRSPSKRQRC